MRVKDGNKNTVLLNEPGPHREKKVQVSDTTMMTRVQMLVSKKKIHKGGGLTYHLLVLLAPNQRYAT